MGVLGRGGGGGVGHLSVMRRIGHTAIGEIVPATHVRAELCKQETYGDGWRDGGTLVLDVSVNQQMVRLPPVENPAS